MGHLELGIVQYIWVWYLHYSLYYLRTLTAVNIWVTYLLQSSNSDQSEIMSNCGFLHLVHVVGEVDLR